jgi:hypothetical protein
MKPPNKPVSPTQFAATLTLSVVTFTTRRERHQGQRKVGSPLTRPWCLHDKPPTKLGVFSKLQIKPSTKVLSLKEVRGAPAILPQRMSGFGHPLPLSHCRHPASHLLISRPIGSFSSTCTTCIQSLEVQLGLLSLER